jgi:hypothetical protein
MLTSICLLTLTLTTGQVLERGEWQLAPRLRRGLELVYTGTYTEESLIPRVQFQRHYRLETTLFVLDANPKQAEVAIMTALDRKDERQGIVQAAHPAPGGSIRLELARVDPQGPVRSVDGKPLTLSVRGPSTLEFGFLAEVPLTRVTRNHFWNVAEEGRTPRTWQVVGTEQVNGVTCLKIIGQQQSDDWDRPRADQTAWRRKDTLWLWPQFNVAQRVERTIEQRDPGRELPTRRLSVRYDLESWLRYPGKLLEDRQREILAMSKYQEELTPLLQQPAQHHTQLEALLRRVCYHVENQPETPYRRAVLHLKQTVESARRGDAPVPIGHEEPRVLPRAIEPGQRVPDFVVTNLSERHTVRYLRYLGKPTLVILYRPTSSIGREVMLVARDLCL